MKILGQNMNSPLAKKVPSYVGKEQLLVKKDVPGIGIMQFDGAYLEREGSALNYRPYLRLSGVCEEVRADFGEGITSVRFGDAKQCPRVDYIYQFSNEELAQLTLKGLFERGFKTPDIFTTSPFELPMTLNSKVVTPEQGGSIPLVFVEIQDAYGIETDGVHSDYEDLAQYFEQVTIPQHHRTGVYQGLYNEKELSMPEQVTIPLFTTEVERVPLPSESQPEEAFSEEPAYVSKEEADLRRLQKEIEEEVSVKSAEEDALLKAAQAAYRKEQESLEAEPVLESDMSVGLENWNVEDALKRQPSSEPKEVYDELLDSIPETSETDLEERIPKEQENKIPPSARPVSMPSDLIDFDDYQYE